MSKYLSSIFLILTLLWAPVLVNATNIVGVDFVGLNTVNEAAARGQLLSTQGTSYSSRNVKQDIKTLYKTGLFGDVSVDKVAVPGGVKLVFKVVEQQMVGKVTLLGNKKFKDDELQDAIFVNAMEPVDRSRLAQTKSAITKLYEEKGYFLVDVQIDIEPYDQGDGQVEVVIRIKENKKVKVRRIKFLGNKVFSDKKLRKKIKTKEKGFLSFISGAGKLESEKLNVDLQMLRYFYMDNGYLRVKVDEPQITLTKDKQAIYISIPVYEGDRYKVGTVDIGGDILTTVDELRESVKLKTGEYYRKSIEIEDINNLVRLYGDQAYAFANVIPNVQTNDDSLTADVVYVVQKGPKVKIEKIIIEGNDVTRDKVIRRELRLIENAYFSQSALELSRTRLYQLGYFEDVNISTPRGSQDSTVNVVINVKEKNTGNFSIGAGFSTLESFIFTATVQKDNFFGRGWSGGVSANMSKLRQDIMLSINDRYFLDTKWFLGLTFQRFQSQLNRDFDQNRLGGSITLGREIFDFFNLRVGYQIDDIKVKNFSTLVPRFFQDNASGLTSALFSSMIYDRRDNRIQTKKGYYLSVTGEWSDSYLGASNKYIRLNTDNRFFIKLPKSFVFKGRGMLGYINSLDNSPVPLFNRFFLGGITTLRGYNLNSIGPQISVPANAFGRDTGFTYGGNKMAMFNLELEVPIYAQAGFYLVGFFDAGNAYGEDQSLDITNLRSDYGFGVRWQSPFGPLRFEWGFPIGKRPGESGVVFNFTIGQSF